MGDVAVKCSKCGHELKVSEFADFGEMQCPKCGGAFERPQQERLRVPTTVRYGAALDSDSKDDVPAEAADSTEPTRPVFRMKRRRLRLGSFTVSEHLLSWVLFILLGGGFGYLRYGDVLTSAGLETARLYGMIGFGLIFVTAIIEALSEDMFEGMLCVLLPPYTLFYLFVKSDSFYLRALMAALIVGFGQDVTLLLAVYFGDMFHKIDSWIRGGGALS